MEKQKTKNLKKDFIIKTCVYACICFVLLLSLIFSSFFEKLLNNTWVFYESDFVASKVKVHFIDVGQGDCSFVQVGNTSIMVDCGPEDSANGTIRYLNNLGFKKNSKIDYLILTHTDLDHVGGALKLLNEFSFSNIYIPKVYSNFEVESGLNIHNYNVENSNIWNNISKALYNEVSKDNIFYNFAGDEISNEVFSLNYFSPTQDNYAYSNDYSPIMFLSCNNFKVCFTGDSSIYKEYDFLDDNETLVNENYFDCDVLKVAHHGSKNSTSSSFLKALKPELAVISVGQNSYGHPNEEVLNRIEDANCCVLRTDLTGSIVIYKTQDNIKVKTNFLFVGKIYFEWWCFVLSFVLIVCFYYILFVSNYRKTRIKNNKKLK